jgi:hypothetical protein
VVSERHRCWMSSGQALTKSRTRRISRLKSLGLTKYYSVGPTLR